MQVNLQGIPLEVEIEVGFFLKKTITAISEVMSLPSIIVNLFFEKLQGVGGNSASKYLPVEP